VPCPWKVFQSHVEPGSKPKEAALTQSLGIWR